jgi:hypothetical protein
MISQSQRLFIDDWLDSTELALEKPLISIHASSIF